MATNSNVNAGMFYTAASTSGSRKPARPVQAKTAKQDVAFNDRVACSKCQISYYVPLGYKPICPLCDAEKRITELRRALYQAEQHAIKAEAQAHQVQTHVDIVLAIRDALEIMSVDDLAFLKSVLYRYRERKAGVQLKLIHGVPSHGRKKPPINGFLAVYQDGEPEAHECTSMGGLAVAGYYQEALQLAGSAKAMEHLHRALSTQMAAPA